MIQPGVEVVFGGDGLYSSFPGDNRQRGRLLPADRPNYSGKYRLASENEIGPSFARRTIYLQKHALKQFPAYLNRWDSQQARNEGVFAH
jgi:hypothetical protein